MFNTWEGQKHTYISLAPGAHACHPSYSGGRDQEDRSSKPAQQIVHKTLPWKKSNTKQGWQSGSNPSTEKKK
jgi:hypothetical protein